MKFGVIADNVTLSEGCTCSTLVKWFTVLIFSLVVVTSLIGNSFFMSVSIDWKKTSTMTCSSISCKISKSNNLFQTSYIVNYLTTRPFKLHSKLNILFQTYDFSAISETQREKYHQNNIPQSMTFWTDSIADGKAPLRMMLTRSAITLVVA